MMKKVIVTIGVLMGCASFVNAQRGSTQPLEPSKKAQQTHSTHTVKPQRAKNNETVPAHTEVKNKDANHQIDNATNRELMRSEQKSSEKMRKEVIK